MLQKKRLTAAARLIILLGLVPAAIFPQAAQKKITYEQAYLNKEPLLFKPMTTGSWLDDENYLLRERDEKTKAMRLLKV